MLHGALIAVGAFTLFLVLANNASGAWILFWLVVCVVGAVAYVHHVVGRYH